MGIVLERRITAIHEAGHLLIATVSDITVLRVVLRVDVGADSNGFVETKRWGVPSPAYLQRFPYLILGGQAAENGHFRIRPRWNDLRDFTKIIHALLDIYLDEAPYQALTKEEQANFRLLQFRDRYRLTHAYLRQPRCRRLINQIAKTALDTGGLRGSRLAAVQQQIRAQAPRFHMKAALLARPLHYP